MVEKVESESGWSLRTASLRLEFQWQRDRWIHILQLLGGERALPVASSFEHDPDRDEPTRVVSPTFQEIQFREDAPELFLLGRSGPHHFSAVVAVWDGDDTSVEVDVADRCREPMESLASTYTVALTAGELRHADTAVVSWAPSAFPGRELCLEGLGRTAISLGEGTRSSLRIQASAPAEQSSFTHRCQFRWVWRWVRGG
jgi:hypothetical protein